MIEGFEAAAQARADAVRQSTDRPSQRRSSAEPSSVAVVRGLLEPTELRAVKNDAGGDVVEVVGFASVTETPYEMYDIFGPYQEVVSAGAFAATLKRSPLVELTVNHGAGGGLPMAHTRNGTLTLRETTVGLKYVAQVDPSRSDVADMLKAIERGDLAESSFKFRIDAGVWSPDYSEYRINAVDLNRGDVSPVNFGANPFTGDHPLSASRDEDATVEVREEKPADMRAALLALYLDA